MKNNFVKMFAALLAIMLVMGSVAAVAQTSRGTVTGTIVDPSGAVVPNATVKLTEKATGVTRETKSNDAGIYRFDSVTLGEHSIAIEAAGFKKAAVTSVMVSNARAAVADVKLAMGTQGESVTVEATAQQLQTEDQTRGGSVDSRQLTNLPVIGQNSLNLMLNLPGVVTSNMGGSLDSGLGSVNGARPRSNNFMIDGAANNDISVAGPAYTVTNNDALKEVAVQTGNFSAEFGRSGGAIVNQVTKSGTNSIHGTLAWVYISPEFNASNRTQRNAYIPAYNAWVAAGKTGTEPVLKPKYKENIPAFTIGGPVIIPGLYDGRNKTFWFAAGQWDRYSAGGSQSSYRLPTDAGFATLQALAPTCPNVAAYLALIGSARGDAGNTPSTTSIALPATMAATSCGGGARTNQSVQTGLYTRTAQALYLDNNHQVRIDHVVSPKQQMMFRWLFDDILDSPTNIGFSKDFDTNFDGRTMNGTFNDTYIIRNNLTNEFRFSYGRINYGWFIGGPAAVLPTIAVSGLSTLQLDSTYPQGRKANTFQYQDTMSWVKGRHQLRFGGDILRQYAVQVAPFNSRGGVSYASSNTAASGGFIEGMANWIDNFTGTTGGFASIQFGSGRYTPNLFQWNLFIQDSWKITSNLTINMGLRYENYGQPANQFKYPAFTGFTDADILSTAKVNPDNNNFGPTFGFAYSPRWSNGVLGWFSGNGKAVIRGGYQVTYDAWYNNLLSNMAAGSPNTLSNNPIVGVSNATTPRGIANASAILPTLTPVPVTPFSNVTSTFDQNIRNPYTHRFSLGIQRELPGKLVMDLSYVGSLGRQLFRTVPLNPALPNATFTQQKTATATDSGRLFPNRGLIQIRDSGQNSNYHSGQFSLRRQYADTKIGNVQFESNVTWSRNMDTATETFGTNSSPQNPSLSPAIVALNGFNVGIDYGPADTDRRLRWATTMVWDIRGPKDGWKGQLFGGWSLAGIIPIQTGTPYTPINGIDRDFDGSSLGDRPDVGNWNAPIRSRARTVLTSVCSTGLRDVDTLQCVTANDVRWIARDGYALPNANTSRRNSIYTDGQVVMHTNIIKRFNVTERWKFEYRAEIFNILNQENFNTPAATRTVSATTTQFLNYANLNGGNRSMRMGLKIIF